MTRAEILAGPCLHEVLDIEVAAPAVIITEPLRWVQPTAILCGAPVNFKACNHGGHGQSRDHTPSSFTDLNSVVHHRSAE